MLYMSHDLTGSLLHWEGKLYRILGTVAPNKVSQGRKIISHIKKLFLFTIVSEGEHQITSTPSAQVSLLIRHKKKTESSEYLYNVSLCIQGAHLETNHPYNNYSPLGMSKKGSLFTSANVRPGDQLNT